MQSALATPITYLESMTRWMPLGKANPSSFSTFDLRSGYWQVELDGQHARDRSAFVCHSGLYEFNVIVMCFGQKSAPATFQRLMESVLRVLNQRICLVYLDDVIVFSITFEQHLVHLAQTFQAFSNANLTLKPSKCFFFRKELKFLGFKVNEQGIKVDDEKVKAIVKFPVPSPEVLPRHIEFLQKVCTGLCKDCVPAQ
jgi:hypothetical protein